MGIAMLLYINVRKSVLKLVSSDFFTTVWSCYYALCALMASRMRSRPVRITLFGIARFRRI